MTIYHQHHIIPRHMGGTDDPSNLIQLTIEEHAEAHRLLYEEHGRWQDKLAWMGLSKMIGKDEILKILYEKNRAAKPMAGKKHSEETKRKMSETRKGFKHTQETRQKMSNSMRGPKSEAHIKKLTEVVNNGHHPFSKNTTCPHCGATGQTAIMKRWHFDNCKHRSS